MPVNSGDIIRATAKMTYVGDDVQNVYHLQYLGVTTLDSSVVNGIAGVLDDAYDYIDLFISDNVGFDTIEVWNITQNRLLDEVNWPTLVSGGGVDSALPTQVSALALFNTAVANSQGRKYLPVFTEAENLGGGIISSAALAAIALFIAELLGEVVLPDGECYFGNWNPTLARFADWVSGYISDRMQTQRRRTVGHGS